MSVFNAPGRKGVSKYVRHMNLKLKDVEIKKEDRIQDSNTQFVCHRCYQKLTWKFNYDKYRPLKTPGTCQNCKNKCVFRAYRTFCDSCATSKNCCSACTTPITKENAYNALRAQEEASGKTVEARTLPVSAHSHVITLTDDSWKPGEGGINMSSLINNPGVNNSNSNSNSNSTRFKRNKHVKFDAEGGEDFEDDEEDEEDDDDDKEENEEECDDDLELDDDGDAENLAEEIEEAIAREAGIDNIAIIGAGGDANEVQAGGEGEDNEEEEEEEEEEYESKDV